MSHNQSLLYVLLGILCPIFASLEVMPKVSTALHLPIVHDNITGQLANDNDNYKFSACPYSVSQEFAVEIEVMITSHSEVVREPRSTYGLV